MAKETECNERADAKNFGIHHSPVRDPMQLLAYRILPSGRVPITKLRSSGRLPWLKFEKQAALLPSNSVHVNVSTICRIGLVCAQARIETE
jgi:hypothetical protein